MKKIAFILGILFVGAIEISAKNLSDTTVVEFTDKGNKKRISIYTPSGKDFDLPKNLNIGSILKSIGVDSIEIDKAIVSVGNNQDTIVVVTREGKNIKIIARTPNKSETRTNEDTDHWSHGEAQDGSSNNTTGKAAKKARFFPKNDFGVYLGLNNWIPSQTETALRPLGSRYFAMSFRRYLVLSKSKKTDIAISYSPEIQWNNFMFEDNHVITNRGSQFRLTSANNDVKKSKLVISSLNLPIMLHWGFKESKINFGVGGYLNYRLSSYTKIKDNSGKEKIRGSYGLNDFRYGLTAEVGKRRGSTFFVRYDLGKIFRKDQIYLNDLQAWSVGVRF